MKHSPPDPASILEHFAGHLHQQALKITGPRRAILDLLAAQSHPLTIRELHQRLPRKSCDLATLYRSMHLMEKLGLVKRFDFGDGIARFELVTHADDAHHHHLICKSCSTVVELDQCFPIELENKIASHSGFSAITHKLEFFGICPSCQSR